MPALFDMLYSEFCRARLVEMRKQLFLSQTNSPVSTEADGKTRVPFTLSTPNNAPVTAALEVFIRPSIFSSFMRRRR